MEDLLKTKVPTKKLEAAKKAAEDLYKTIGETYCPYFKGKVVFNAQGLEHLKFSRRSQARPITDQYMRLRLLKLAPEIIGKAGTLQELWETKKFENQKIGSRREKLMVNVTYYTFIAIVRGSRMKIVVKQIEKGPKFFWSLVPFWKNDKKNTQTKKILHSGNPEED